MRIENLSIRTLTISIFAMIGLVSIALSILAGSYFKKSALDAQVNSLSRVIEVASQEVLKEIRTHTFDLGMKLAHSNEIIIAVKNAHRDDGHKRLISLLDDPFVNGFGGFSLVDLEKIRVYDINLNFIAESSEGIQDLQKGLPEFVFNQVTNRQGVEKLKSADALIMTPQGPLHSTIVPIGGLRLVGYLEIYVNPVFNLAEIGNITQTAISIYSATGSPIKIGRRPDSDNTYLPIKFTLHTSDGQPAFQIIGHENINKLNMEMTQTKFTSITAFMLLLFITLIFALRLFNRFLFTPLNSMTREMSKIANGQLDLYINEKGLHDFYNLANSFNIMTEQVRKRTSELEQLLDLEGNAILCFDHDHQAVYHNKIANDMFGYKDSEINELDLSDLFSEDIDLLIKNAESNGAHKMHHQLQCKHKQGYTFSRSALISHVLIGNNKSYAVVLSTAEQHIPGQPKGHGKNIQPHNEDQLGIIEKSLHGFLEIIKNDPDLLAGLNRQDNARVQNIIPSHKKNRLREQAVKVMHTTLSCWEHELGKSKLDLAEESRIWPVYIDKSTPTTRTLDKYLHIESCPQNPRIQRVIDTAEFVLRKLKKSTPLKQTLEQELTSLRLYRTGSSSPD